MRSIICNPASMLPLGLIGNDATRLWSKRGGLRQSPKSRPPAVAIMPAQNTLAILRQQNTLAILRQQNTLSERDVLCPLVM